LEDTLVAITLGHAVGGKSTGIDAVEDVVTGAEDEPVLRVTV
jgi:hypothetical protein